MDWLLKLPKDLEARFRQQVCEFEAKQVMPYVTSIEEYGIEKGIEKGIERGQVMACRQNILDLLEARFGAVPEGARARVDAETDLQRLRALLRLAGTCAAAQDFPLN